MMCAWQRRHFSRRSPISLALSALQAIVTPPQGKLTIGRTPRPALVTLRNSLSNRPLGWNPAWAGLTTGVS